MEAEPSVYLLPLARGAADGMGALACECIMYRHAEDADCTVFAETRGRLPNCPTKHFLVYAGLLPRRL